MSVIVEQSRRRWTSVEIMMIFMTEVESNEHSAESGWKKWMILKALKHSGNYWKEQQKKTKR